jgi:hypothetical protein
MAESYIVRKGGGDFDFSKSVVIDNSNTKYEFYNGFDKLTNPNPITSENVAFNRWVVNNSTTGKTIYENVTVVAGDVYNGANTVVNTSNLNYIERVTGSGGFPFPVNSVTFFRNSLYWAHSGSPNYNAISVANSITNITNTSLYVMLNAPRWFNFYNNNLIAFAVNNRIYRYSTDPLNTINFTLLSNTASQAVGAVMSYKIHNDRLYIGDSANKISVYHAGNATFISNITSIGGNVYDIEADGNYLLISSGFDGTGQRLRFYNLVSNTVESIFSDINVFGYGYSGNKTMRVYGDKLYVFKHLSPQGIYVVNLKNNFSNVFYNIGSTIDAAFDDEHLYQYQYQNIIKRNISNLNQEIAFRNTSTNNAFQLAHNEITKVDRFLFITGYDNTNGALQKMSAYSIATPDLKQSYIITKTKG